MPKVKAPSDSQINYAKHLLKQLGEPEPDWDKLTGIEVSEIIDGIKKKRGKPTWYGDGSFRGWERSGVESLGPTDHYIEKCRVCGTTNPEAVTPVPGTIWTRVAGIERIDLAWVQKLRKDFLALPKNIPRVKDYKTAHELRHALNIYRKNFDELFFERFLKHDLKYEMGLDVSTVKWLDKKLRSVAWSFSSELSSMPIGFADEYRSKGELFARFEREAPKWKNRVQAKARAFWNELTDTLDWYSSAKDKPGFDVKTPDVDQVVLEGFRVQIRGYDPKEKYGAKGLEVFKEGLKIYRQKAAARLPILLQKQCPLIFECGAEIDKGGEYYPGGIIKVYAWGLSSETPARAAHVLAHEMGHHLYKTYLSSEAAKFWDQTIRGDYGDLDLKELLDKWPDDAWAFDMPEKMKDDPVLALQVAAYSGHRENQNTQRKADFQALYDKGERTLRVPKTPITGYAGKSAEEAFCDAIGLFVAYGPRAVHERVRWWLETVLPGHTKLAQHVLTRWLAAKS